MVLEQRDLSIDSVFFKVKGNDAASVMDALADHVASDTGLARDDVRRSLSCHQTSDVSAMGEGVAVVEAKIASRFTRPYRAVAVLKNAVDFGGPDGRPVDLVSILVSPARDGDAVHLRRLSRLTRFMRDRVLCAKIRGADCAEGIMALLMAGPGGWLIAA